MAVNGDLSWVKVRKLTNGFEGERAGSYTAVNSHMAGGVLELVNQLYKWKQVARSPQRIALKLQDAKKRLKNRRSFHIRAIMLSDFHRLFTVSLPSKRLLKL